MKKKDLGPRKCALTGNFQQYQRKSRNNNSLVWSRRMETPGKMFPEKRIKIFP